MPYIRKYSNPIALDKFHIVEHNNKYIMLDINTSRCLEITEEAYKSISEGIFSPTIFEIINEYEKLISSGYIESKVPDKALSLEDCTIHEIQFGIYTQCNLSCKYCFRHGRYSEDKKVSIASAKRLIDQIIQKLVIDKDVSWFFFNMGLMGEALVDVAFLELLQEHIYSWATSLGKNINAVFHNTNATLLTNAMARRLWENCHMSEVTISVDGPKELHDSVRCYKDGRGTYDDIEPLVLRYNKEFRGVGEATLTSKNPYVLDIFTHLYKLGFRSICIKPVRVRPESEYAINVSNVDIVKQEYSRFIDFLISQDDEKLLDYLSAINTRDFFGKLFYRIYLGEIALRRCNALVSLIAIDEKGDIFPCAGMCGIEKFRLGNIFSSDEAWQKKRLELLSSFHLNWKTECSSCWAKNLCGGGCPNSAYLANDTIDVPDLAKCELLKHLSEQAMILVSEINSRENVRSALDSKFRPRNSQAVLPVSYCKYTAVSPLESTAVWEKASIIRLTRKEQFRGYKTSDSKDNYISEVRTLWDDNNFYLKIDLPLDFIEVASEINDENLVRFSITNDTSSIPIEYGIAFYCGNPILLKLRMQDATKNRFGEIKTAVININIEEQRSYMLSVPWYELKCKPETDAAFIFNVVVYTSDHPYGGKAWFEWSPGMVVECNPEIFGNLKFI